MAAARLPVALPIEVIVAWAQSPAADTDAADSVHGLLDSAQEAYGELVMIRTYSESLSSSKAADLVLAYAARGRMRELTEAISADVADLMQLRSTYDTAIRQWAIDLFTDPDADPQSFTPGVRHWLGTQGHTAAAMDFARAGQSEQLAVLTSRWGA